MASGNGAMSAAHAEHMRNFAITVRSRAIGDPNDPYQETTVSCKNIETGWAFKSVEDGLGRARLTIYKPIVPGQSVPQRHSHWEVYGTGSLNRVTSFQTDECDNDHEHVSDMRDVQAHADMRNTECERLVGCTPAQAEEWFNATYEEDPMDREYRGYI